MVELEFIHCRNSTVCDPEMAATFLANHVLGVISLYNYIEFDQVETLENTLK